MTAPAKKKEGVRAKEGSARQNLMAADVFSESGERDKRARVHKEELEVGGNVRCVCYGKGDPRFHEFFSFFFRFFRFFSALYIYPPPKKKSTIQKKMAHIITR